MSNENKSLKFLNIKNRQILYVDFYSRDTALVAKQLIGKLLVRKVEDKELGGIIVETEAYYGFDDPASHAYRGRTKRAKIMFGRAGKAYVYFCYGMYYLLNAVTEAEGVPGAVLIRAIEPIFGIEEMVKRRKIKDIKNLTNGPGKLASAIGIDINDNGKDLTDSSSDLNIYDVFMKINKLEIATSPRIGITAGKEKNLRFYLLNNEFVSRS